MCILHGHHKHIHGHGEENEDEEKKKEEEVSIKMKRKNKKIEYPIILYPFRWSVSVSRSRENRPVFKRRRRCMPSCPVLVVVKSIPVNPHFIPLEVATVLAKYYTPFHFKGIE